MLASAIVVNVVIYSKFSKMRSAHYIYICTYIDYSIMYYRRKGERKSGFSILSLEFYLAHGYLRKALMWKGTHYLLNYCTVEGYFQVLQIHCIYCIYYIYNIPPDPQFLLLVLVQILNVELIVVGKPYCCLLLVLNINNNNFS